MFKNHRLQFAVFSLLVFASLGLSTVSAADTLDQQPLFKMLARIPNTTMSRSEIYFNDRKAVEVAYPSAKMPKDWAEFKAMSDARGENPDLIPVDIWWRVWRNQSSALTARYMNASKDSPLVVGFDYFQIEQKMMYGTPPDQTLQFAGQFYDKSVRMAFSLRGYTRQADKDIELWCPEAGCESGSKLNPSSIDFANPFGGNLGRNQSLLMIDGALISSASTVSMNNHINVAKNKTDSLADLAQYRAVVEAFSADGTLLQASFVDGELLLQMNSLSPAAALILGERATPESIKEFYQDMLEGYQTLPFYQLLAFGDVASETRQIGEVATAQKRMPKQP